MVLTTNSAAHDDSAYDFREDQKFILRKIPLDKYRFLRKALKNARHQVLLDQNIGINTDIHNNNTIDQPSIINVKSISDAQFNGSQDDTEEIILVHEDLLPSIQAGGCVYENNILDCALPNNVMDIGPENSIRNDNSHNLENSKHQISMYLQGRQDLSTVDGGCIKWLLCNDNYNFDQFDVESTSGAEPNFMHVDGTHENGTQDDVSNEKVIISVHEYRLADLQPEASIHDEYILPVHHPHNNDNSNIDQFNIENTSSAHLNDLHDGIEVLPMTSLQQIKKFCNEHDFMCNKHL